MRAARRHGATPQALLLLALASTLLLQPAAAIYADQAGQYDWLQQHVGAVSLARFAAGGGSGGSLVVASAASGTLASLAPADGSIRWRRVLSDGDAVTALLVAVDHVLTLSDAGRKLQAWDLASGAALWAADLPAGSSGGDLAVLRDADVVLASLPGTVKGFGLSDGAEKWSVALAGDAARLFARTADDAWAVAIDGASLSVARLRADGGAEQQLSLSTPEDGMEAEQLMLSDELIALVAPSGHALCSAAVAAGASKLSCRTLIGDLLPKILTLSEPRVVPGACPGHAVLQGGAHAAVLSLSADGLALVKYIKGSTASGCFLAPGSGVTPLVSLASATPEGTTVRTLLAADGREAQGYSTLAGLAPLYADGKPVPMASAFASGGGKSAFQQLLVFADGSMALAAGGKQAWLRHEELASLQDVLFTDLPAPTPENEAAWAASQPSVQESLAAQLLQLKVQASQLTGAALATPEERARLDAHKALTNDKLRPTRDADGFRKQIVALTTGGKVLALHNGDGRVLWSLDFGPGAGLARLALWRVPHDVAHDIEVVALAPGPAGTKATIISAHTGAKLQELSLPVAASEVLHLPRPVQDGTADQHAYVLVPSGTGGAARVLPDTPAAQAAFQAARPTLSFWRVDAAAGRISGLGFDASGAVEERWSAALAPAGSGQRVLSVSAPVPGEAVFSPARVLGDGSLRFKYLSPNILLVVVGLPRAAAVAEDAEPRLTAVVLDAVTGRVLFSQTHDGASGPVHGAVTENTAAYHFWSVEQHRWQVASIELYDASPTTLTVSDLVFRESSSNSSAWDAAPVEASSQTFLSRLPVVGLAATRSARGNTAKQLIMLTPTGRAYLLDRRMLDPRRPIIAAGSKPTPAQQAEGLPPYTPELPLTGPHYATLDRRVARLAGVAVEAAVLESTQLMLAHGLDLYHTRIMPSRSFDMVPDDFPYALLVLIVVGMTVATGVLSRLQQNAAVKAKWA